MSKFWKQKAKKEDFQKRLELLEQQVVYITEFCQAVRLNEMGVFSMLKTLKLDLSNASAIVDHKNVHVEIPTTYFHEFIKAEKKEVAK